MNACSGSWFRMFAALLLGSIPLVSQSQTFETVRTLPTRGERPLGALAKTDDGDFLGTTLTGGANGFGTIFKITESGTFSTLFDFNFPGAIFPSGGLTKGGDGKFYGVLNQGTTRGLGAVYRVSSSGTYEQLASFTGINGAYPQGSLVQGPGGNFFGVASSSSGKGVIFKLTPAKVLSVVATFDTATTGAIPGSNSVNIGPVTGLINGPGGNFYGVTPSGGANDKGTAFKVTPSGALSVLATFGDPAPNSPENPYGALFASADGEHLYGTTVNGGDNDLGTVFRLTSGGMLTKLASLDSTVGGHPLAGLVEDAGGLLYGVSTTGGANGRGTIFKVTVSGDTATLTKLVDRAADSGPTAASLVFGTGTTLLGVTEYGGSLSAGTIFKVTNLNTITALADLGSSEGTRLSGGLTRGPDNALYGTAENGGAQGLGTFFSIPASPTPPLHSFLRPVSAEPLELANNGKFYGAFTAGGDGYGSIFNITTAGTVSIDVDFPSAEQRIPNGVIQASDGAFYGTTSRRRDDDSTPLTIFRYSTVGGLETLHTFDSATTGLSRLVEGPDGTLYGVAGTDASSSRGIAFRITTDGEFTKLVTFKGPNGAHPTGPMVVGPDRALYGTTFDGGLYNLGVVYRLTTAGTFKVLASFNGSNGAFPGGGLVVGPGGNFYGTSQAGGGNGRYGTVFRVTNKGVITVLKAFKGGSDGSYPTSRIITSPDGNLYGTTYNTVFRLVANNVAPVAVNDALTMPVINANVLKNDTDANNDPLQITGVTQGAHGAVQLSETGKITYIPAADFVASDTFTYTVVDPFGETSTATVTVSLPVNALTAGLGGYKGVLALGGDTRGYSALAVVQAGLFTGAVYLDGVKTTLKGAFVADGSFSKTFTRTGRSSLVVTLTLDPGRNQIVGTIFDGTDTFNVAFERIYPAFSKTQPCPVAGRYTVLFPTALADVSSATVPQGTGYASVAISSTGNVSFVGKLGDGTRLMAASKVSHDNDFPLYVPLYVGKGFLAGFVTVSPQAGTDATGVFSWKKPTTTTGRYTAEFKTNPRFLAAKYTAAAPVLTLPAPPSNAKLVYTNLPLTKSLTISKSNIVTVTNPAADKTLMTINATTGTFTGSYMDGATKRSFAGAIFQKAPTPRGEGFYTRPSTTDIITLSAP